MMKEQFLPVIQIWWKNVAFVSGMSSSLLTCTL